MTLSLVLTLVLVVASLAMLGWLIATLQSKSEILQGQLEERNLALIRSEKEIQRLTTIIASKDPMTFQVLSQAPTTSWPGSEETPYVTDEEEAQRWAILTGKINPDGSDDEDMTDDLRMLGL